MKKTLTLFCAGVLMSILCAGVVACNDEPNGIESKQMTGTIIGSYSNGFSSLLIQVDKKYPIGKTVDYFTSANCTNLPKEGNYKNIIQVPMRLPLSEGSLAENMNKKLSFSLREYQAEKDRDLFTVGSGIGNTMCAPPDAPMYVITECEILNN